MSMMRDRRRRGKTGRVELGPGTGIIGDVYRTKGYGFIVHHNEELDDVFFHFSEYPDPVNIQSGAEVAFECVQNGKSGKFKAQKIRIIKKHTNGMNGRHGGSRIINNKNINKNRNNIMNQHQTKMNQAQTQSIITNNHNSIIGQEYPDAAKLGCFKLVKKDVTDRPMYVPVLPINKGWKSGQRFV